MIRPTPEQRAEMAAFIDAKEPGLLDELGIDRDGPPPIPFVPANPRVCTCVDPFSNCPTHG
jgi:hypothetical protein